MTKSNFQKFPCPKQGVWELNTEMKTSKSGAEYQSVIISIATLTGNQEIHFGIENQRDYYNFEIGADCTEFQVEFPDFISISLQEPGILATLSRYLRAIKAKVARALNSKAFMNALARFENHEPNRPNSQFQPQTISIIIPTKDRADLLEGLLNSGVLSVFERGAELILIDNQSEEIQTKVLFDNLKTKGAKIIRDNDNFNYSRLINKGLNHAQRDIIIVLNNDIVLNSEEDIIRAASWLENRELGVIGTCLLYPNKSIQHIGIALGMGGVCGHFGRGENYENEKFPFFRYPILTSAVTGAFAAFRRKDALAINGFDENYQIECSDIDFCLRMSEFGGATLCDNSIVATHFESQTRGIQNSEINLATLQDRRKFIEKWKHKFHNDAFYPKELDKRTEKITLAIN